MLRALVLLQPFLNRFALWTLLALLFLLPWVERALHVFGHARFDTIRYVLDQRTKQVGFGDKEEGESNESVWGDVSALVSAIGVRFSGAGFWSVHLIAAAAVVSHITVHVKCCAAVFLQCGRFCTLSRSTALFFVASVSAGCRRTRTLDVFLFLNSERVFGVWCRCPRPANLHVITQLFLWLVPCMVLSIFCRPC